MYAVAGPLPLSTPRAGRRCWSRQASEQRTRCLSAARPSDLACSHALKEWASVCASLEAGETSVLLRKGGKAEKGFKLHARRFAFYGTAFHDAAAYLQPAQAAAHGGAQGCVPGEDARLSLVGEVTGAWETGEPDVLALLSAFHPWSEELLKTRLNWRPHDKLTVLEVRAWRLENEETLAGAPDHGGCKSWIHLPAQLRGRATPIMDEQAWQARQAATREALAHLAAQGALSAIPLPDDA